MRANFHESFDQGSIKPPSMDRYLSRSIHTVQGCLKEFDAKLIATLLRTQAASRTAGHLCEIGVHHGRLFFLLALARQDGERALAIDLLERLDQHQYETRWTRPSATRQCSPVGSRAMRRGDFQDVILEHIRRRYPEANRWTGEVFQRRRKPLVSARPERPGVGPNNAGHTRDHRGRRLFQCGLAGGVLRHLRLSAQNRCDRTLRNHVVEALPGDATNRRAVQGDPSRPWRPPPDQ